MDRLNRGLGAIVDVLTMGPASKLCSLTGWRVGWLLGSEKVISGCKAIHGYSTYVAPPSPPSLDPETRNQSKEEPSPAGNENPESDSGAPSADFALCFVGWLARCRYCAPTVLQHGIAKALDGFTDFSFDGTSDLMKTNAEHFAKVLHDKGFEVYVPSQLPLPLPDFR